MRLNQTVKIPILIQKNSKVDIQSDDFCLFVRNFKKVKNILWWAFKFTVKARNSISINLVCFNTYALCKEEIEVDHDIANLRLADKEFIYNGSYYKAIAA